MMRKLMWFAVGFAAACALGVYLLSGTWLCLCAAFCLLPAIALCFVKTKHAKITAAVLFGCCVAFVWVFGFDALYLSSARKLDGQTLTLTFEASDYSYDTDYGIAVDGTVLLDGNTYQMKAYLSQKEALTPGDRVAGTFRLRYTAFGAKDAPTYHQGKGIFLLGYGREITGYEKAAENLYFPASLRRSILECIDAVFPEDTAGFAKALLLGDTSQIDYATRRNFQTSGISHVIAVSGMHVSILFSLVYLLCGKKRILTALIGIPVLILFAAVAGFTPSIVRACIMQSLMILALLLKREYDPPTALGFSVLVILMVNPMSITSIGLQLSVACMIGIFAFSSRISTRLLGSRAGEKGRSLKKRMLRWLVASVSITISTMITTVPLCALHFGMVSIVGVLTNLLAVWVVSFIFYGIMLSCILGLIWLPLGMGLAWLVNWPIRYVLFLSGFLGKLPVAAVYTQSVYVVIWLVFSYALLLLLWINGRKHLKITSACIAAGLVIALALSWLEPRLDNCRVSVLDVGQGQCILLQSGEEHYLVDCGSERVNTAADAALNLLASRGIFHLDGVILTHYDGDHASDVVNLLHQIPVHALYLPDLHDTNSLREQIQSTYAGPIHWIAKDYQISLHAGNITLFPSQITANDNESRMCVLYQPLNYDILITGDRSARGERELIRHTSLPKLELLVAGHHGAKNATGVEILTVTQPDVVAISVGKDNHYDHPSRETLQRLSRCGCKVVRTDEQGTVEFRG